MTEMDAWSSAFPIRPASKAVEALCESWRVLSAVKRPHFHSGIREPRLTRALKAHVERVTSRDYGLLGMWATEAVQNEVDFHTGKLIEERRTDIVYGWNNEEVGIQLVFEFKKLSRSARSRNLYLGEDGLGRFVTGIYGRGQPVAVMVGILRGPEDQIVPPLRYSLANAKKVASLRLKPAQNGHFYFRPSLLFPEADFDTEHDRDAHLVPDHGTIRIAHIFLTFGYTKP